MSGHLWLLLGSVVLVEDLRAVSQRVVRCLPCSVSDRGASRSYTALICAFSDNVPGIVGTFQDDLITTNRNPRSSGESPPTSPVCVFRGRRWRGCGTTPSGTLARSPPSAAAAAVPAPSLRRGRRAVVLLLPATTGIFQVLGGAAVVQGALSARLPLSSSCVVRGSGGLIQDPLCAGLDVVGL